MIAVYKNPAPALWNEILQRKLFPKDQLRDTVRGILEEVKQNGDAAVRMYGQRFDGISRQLLRVPETEISSAVNEVSDELKYAIRQAAGNITRFHESQCRAEPEIETMPGVRCWRRSVGIEKVGLYVPGGSAPLFSTLLMLAIPARLAGCRDIIVCTPPRSDGTVHATIRYCASLLGLTSIYCIGGAQAIAAMAFGTETVPRTYKIFGPGNQYVTEAKELVQQEGIAIDMPAGPSEVCILADETADPRFIAADLLSQAEHGADSHCVFITTSEALLDNVNMELDLQVEQLSRASVIRQALASAKGILVQDIDTAIKIVNAYAPEHLLICTSNDDAVAFQISNAGSVFLGHYSPESAGDYASGTNHTLPTNGFARAFSGVSVDSFVKKITYQRLTKEGLENISPTVIAMARAEGLDAHANAIKIRLDENN